MYKKNVFPIIHKKVKQLPNTKQSLEWEKNIIFLSFIGKWMALIQGIHFLVVIPLALLESLFKLNRFVSMNRNILHLYTFFFYNYYVNLILNIFFNYESFSTLIKKKFFLVEILYILCIYYVFFII